MSHWHLLRCCSSLLPIIAQLISWDKNLHPMVLQRGVLTAEPLWREDTGMVRRTYPTLQDLRLISLFPYLGTLFVASGVHTHLQRGNTLHITSQAPSWLFEPVQSLGAPGQFLQMVQCLSHSSVAGQSLTAGQARCICEHRRALESSMSREGVESSVKRKNNKTKPCSRLQSLLNIKFN